MCLGSLQQPKPPHKCDTMQDIETIEGLPVIGETYLVRCVEAKLVEKVDFWEWTPIMGYPHEDGMWLGVEFVHYHFDFRFATDKVIEELRIHNNNEVPRAKFVKPEDSRRSCFNYIISIRSAISYI